MQTSLLQRIILLMIFCMLGAITATSQNPRRSEPLSPDDRVTLKQLMDEVHQLRLTIQQSSLIGYRAQIALERIRMQTARVDRLTRQLEQNESELAGIKLSMPQIAERASALEGEARNEQNPAQRLQLEAEYKESKAATDLQREREVQLRESQAQLTSQLQAEQVRLDEMNTRLSQLERDIELQAEGATQRPKKQP